MILLYGHLPDFASPYLPAILRRLHPFSLPANLHQASDLSMALLAFPLVFCLARDICKVVAAFFVQHPIIYRFREEMGSARGYCWKKKNCDMK